MDSSNNFNVKYCDRTKLFAVNPYRLLRISGVDEPSRVIIRQIMRCGTSASGMMKKEILLPLQNEATELLKIFGS